ncbi:hypothetical protein AUR64_06180 [Haloprofundus marisrubri]|uniref:CDP-archaeol synthase n=1 Tax=Haloprofundus marisrubri TaxID=1514971 RepID=A0A0W1RB97_9EURY|nr:CDP-2,3-bis-(O-geranylgeranyl)-sn-glycerol synthase [Haloprofundus marisrubri]KTG10775.1 hypothetical protein AUR64_06180 [Haloprofundus marisrubri]
MVISQLVSAVWSMLPAYVPNNAAVLSGGGDPIDGGRTLGGRRLLGDGKTWRGTAVGSVVGVVLAVVLNLVRERAETKLGVSLPEFSLGGAVGLSVGAMLGDIAASFLKRRTGRERGASFPLVDQLDFVVGALGLAKLLSPSWFSRTFTPVRLVVVVLVTPVLHLVTNGIAYLLGLKDEPW